MSAKERQSQFSDGYKPDIQHQPRPGTQTSLEPEPASTKLPSNSASDSESGYTSYRAASKLQDKVAVITGGDSGIGRAITLLFALEGADSLITYLPEEEKDAKETKRRVEQVEGRQCHLFETDLTSAENCRKVANKAIDLWGRVDVLVNNAATQLVQKDILDISDEQWHQTFATNIHPLFHLSKAVIPHMPRGSSIINNASINAYIGRPDLLDYTSSKGAVVAFTRGLANQQLQKRGIRVNAVAPGPVWTPLIPATMDESAQEGFTSPMGRPAQPSEIASCFVWLASSEAAAFAGQTLHPNGGVVVNG